MVWSCINYTPFCPKSDSCEQGEKIWAVAGAALLGNWCICCFPFYVMSVSVSLCVFRIQLNDVCTVETEKQTGEFVSY
jgi:hypothetical protein